MSDTPITDEYSLDEREGVTHPDLCETYMAWTDYWALRECSRRLERENAALKALLRQKDEALERLARALRKAVAEKEAELEGFRRNLGRDPLVKVEWLDDARAALAADAKPEQPVAWRYKLSDAGDWHLVSYEPQGKSTLAVCEPLYAHPTPASGEQE